MPQQNVLVPSTWTSEVDSVLFVFGKDFCQTRLFPFFLVNVDDSLRDFLPDSDLKMYSNDQNHTKIESASNSSILGILSQSSWNFFLFHCIFREDKSIPLVNNPILKCQP